MAKNIYLIGCLLFYFLCPCYSQSGIHDGRVKVKSVYESQIGVRELTGKNDGKSVESYLSYVKLGKGYAWCAAFVCWTYGQANIANPRSAWSPDIFPAKAVIYDRNKKENQIPEQGDAFGIYFPDKKRIAHVGFIDKWGTTEVITVEGNTNKAGSREGDGVYRKRRLTGQIYKVARFIK